MADTQTDRQEAATATPVVAPDQPAELRRHGEKISEREYLDRRKAQRRAVVEAAKTVTESPNPEAATQSAETEETTEVNREEPGSESAEAQTEAETEGQETEPVASQEGQEAQESEGEEYFPETLTEFAEALGVDSKDFLAGVTAQVKVNGEMRDVSLEEALRSYSSTSERERLGQAVAEERKAMEAESQQRRDEWTNRIQQADTFLQVASSLLDMGPSEQQLAELAQTDEIAYLKARADRDQKVQQIQAVAAHRQELVNRAQQEQQEERLKFRKQQQDGLMDWRPELQDASKLSAFENRLRTGLKTHYGYGDENVNNFFQTFDLRDLKVLDDAMKYREMKSQEKPIRQRLKTLPKLSKPGQKRTDAQLASDKVQSARNRLKSSGTTEDAMALLRANRARRNQNRGRSK